jgi:Lactonase, 7-bladed beta-propeller
MPNTITHDMQGSTFEDLNRSKKSRYFQRLDSNFFPNSTSKELHLTMKFHNYILQVLTCSVLCHATKIYISSYSGNITTVSVDPKADGNLTLTTIVSTLGCLPNPSWLELDKKTSTLYCADEGLSTSNSNFTAFSTSPNGILSPLGRIVTLNGGVYSKIYGNGSALALAN